MAHVSPYMSFGIKVPNDLGDGDTGPNNWQNYPVLTSDSSNGTSTTTASGTINTTPNSVTVITRGANEKRFDRAEP